MVSRKGGMFPSIGYGRKEQTIPEGCVCNGNLEEEGGG